MPIETKQRLAAAGNALEEELTALVPYLHSLNEPLGKAAEVAGSKMRYQMNRLRRLAANFELSRNPHLSKHAQALQTNLFPDRHPQERTLGAAWFLCRYGDSLPSLLVEHAGQQVPATKQSGSRVSSLKFAEQFDESTRTLKKPSGAKSL